MSDPVEQGEQVEVYLTGEALKERDRLLERVRLLEQREKGLRKVAHELVGFVRGGYGDSGEYAGTLRLIADHADEALATTQASGEESDD